MTLAGTPCSGESCGGGAVVVVGVKLDSRSRELLTWALVKVAQAGDRVIALHVLDPSADKTSLISLVKTFDSVLAAYEGFCNLKQVDLKLKVCRGSPVRKILSREAKSCGATSLIVGTSEVRHTIRSRISVAKYCAKNLQNNILVVCADNELKGLGEKYYTTCQSFSFKELLQATNNFAPENLIGKGGSSEVYRGCLQGGKELAVKILKPSGDALEQFLSEINIITSLRHKNIISLVGFCLEDDRLLLVYDLLSRGSLEDNLHGTQKFGKSFGWEERYKVALGVAEALDYLHNTAEPIIHRDVKSSNILLSDDFEPQLADFGLATWASSCSHHIGASDVTGTFGYLAPEYFMHGKLDEKIDVYAFGVVLLELLSGRKPIDNGHPTGQESLVMWARHILKKGDISELQDPDLAGKYDNDQVEKIVSAATLCIRDSPQSRPEISLILKLLQGSPEVIEWARTEIDSSKAENDILGEPSPTNIQSFLNLALLNLENESDSISSTEQNISVEDYLGGRWSRSTSFD
ncbi:protein kinase STUNTED-like isoform X2 [Henckelia pumila]|uniref:protein kinase STUNTED-like isoform X2 n=1 Tax=Henckelia pumila TaxID=405737 RepID=UPI003C6E83B7